MHRVCEEVRNIMLTRATLMNTAQPINIGALEKEKQENGKKGDKGRGKGKGKQPSQLKAHERKRMRTQRRMFSVATLGRRDKENVNVVSTLRFQGSAQEAFAEDETPPSCEAYEAAEFSCLASPHCTAMATSKEADWSSTVVDHSRLARHSSVQEQPRDPLPVRHLSESGFNVKDKHRRQFPGCRRSPTDHCRQRLDGDGL